MERNISRAIVLGVLDAGDLIEDYPASRTFPCGLMFGWDGPRPIHVVTALDRASLTVHVITAYEPDPVLFGPDCRTRRRQ